MKKRLEIIPAIDIIEGKCVRLNQGRFTSSKVYHHDPVEVAMIFSHEGIRNLHLVDLDGARQGEVVNYKILEKIAQKTDLKIDFGGGIQSSKDIQIAFECGAQQVTAGSVAVKNEKLFLEWLSGYGSEKIILGADAKDKKIMISGWTESSEIGINEFIRKFVDKDIKYVISTDVSKDGLLQGPAIDLYKELQDGFPELNIIASGGVSSMDDIHSLSETGVYGVIIGKALYEEKIALSDLKEFLC